MFPSGIFIIISEDGDDQGCDFDAPTAIRKDDASGKASMRLHSGMLRDLPWEMAQFFREA